MTRKVDSLQREFGARVRELRQRANLKQRELATRCGGKFAMQRIGQIERGEMNCTLRTIAALARGLRCDPIDLFLFPVRRSGAEVRLPDARLADLWRAAPATTKAKILRILAELL